MIAVEHLTKYYGEHLAVDDLSFEIPDGHVYGFLGPNGAGKSTTMNIMTGCLSATDGRVLVGGHDIFEEPQEAKRLIGYLPEQPPLYLNENAVDYLKFVGKAKGLRGAELTRQVEKVITQTGIEHVKHRRIATLSKGYKQRVGIAQALLGNPKIIILDEPTVGLDPLQIIEIRDLIKSLGEKHTVILSSHILSEVQAICDKILMIAHGKLVAYDTPENLEKSLLSPNEIELVADGSEDDVLDILEELEGITEISEGEVITANGSVMNSDTEEPAETEALPASYTRIRVKTDMPDLYELSRKVFYAFAENKIALLEMNLKKANLEDIFIELADQPADGGKSSEDDMQSFIEMDVAPEAGGEEESE